MVNWLAYIIGSSIWPRVHGNPPPLRGTYVFSSNTIFPIPSSNLAILTRCPLLLFWVHGRIPNVSDHAISELGRVFMVWAGPYLCPCFLAHFRVESFVRSPPGSLGCFFWRNDDVWILHVLGSQIKCFNCLGTLYCFPLSVPISPLGRAVGPDLLFFSCPTSTYVQNLC